MEAFLFVLDMVLMVVLLRSLLQAEKAGSAERFGLFSYSDNKISFKNQQSKIIRKKP